MSLVIAAPELMTSAASDLATIGSDLSAAHLAAVAPTVSLVPAAADEVSTGIAHLFSRYAQDFHGLSGHAAVFHEQFAEHLNASAHSYAATEAANAASLQHLNPGAGSSASDANVPWPVQLVFSVAYSFVQLFQLLEPIIGVQLSTALTEALWFGLIILTAPISIPLSLVVFFWGLSQI
jgi:hypothetical protein